MDNRTHIVALSGGKDSSCMALRLKEVEPRNYVYICTPTGDELPEMEAHWKKLEKLLQAPILRLSDPERPTIYHLIDEMGALPNFRMRFCSRVLKIEVAQSYYEKVKPAVIYVGLRSDEESRKGNKLYDHNIEQRFPLREWGWGINDVWSYLNSKGVEIPRRTDCAMCFWQRIGEWWMLWREHPVHFERIAALEDKIGHTLMTPGKHKIWPHKLSELAVEFQKGRMPREISTGRTSGCRACSL